ncbi:CPBP family intramembrane glutamic endopeptidase [Lactiplantibacillus plantarum]|uniref:CPBP family intramembrane glutamic endopeptidase n=1 Tax=Lactiplantibacillus plantarum TaxID=1590 RepID=UPI001BA8C334|nr:type II CAAX endopeptidase family protein [Lactiplantibacillus plantarum]MBS0935710.1 CPBP family intramembrane metalloprotease [Lactiplantibacillus plantarum]MBS0943933.1 CPBP family intramembrane metalloprotease [Lactiplantibacillus plantarum]MBS0955478.1 CPBP family intramembrane metalloprotease [Lactiplantibacillus plantarum]
MTKQTIPKMIVWGFLMIISQWLTGILMQGLIENDVGLVSLGLIGLIGMIGWLAYGCRAWLNLTFTRKNWLWGVGALISLIVTSLIWVLIMQLVTGLAMTTNQQQLNQNLIWTGWRQAVMVLQVVLIAPVLEELLFRGLFQAWFLKQQEIWQLVISSLLFAWLHTGSGGSGGAWVLYFSAGLILGYCYQQTKDLKVNIAVHGLYNWISLII